MCRFECVSILVDGEPPAGMDSIGLCGLVTEGLHTNTGRWQAVPHVLVVVQTPMALPALSLRRSRALRGRGDDSSVVADGRVSSSATGGSPVADTNEIPGCEVRR